MLHPFQCVEVSCFEGKLQAVFLASDDQVIGLDPTKGTKSFIWRDEKAQTKVLHYFISL